MPEENQEMNYNNSCGNSPIYGKHMWEISACKMAIHAKEDCTFDVSYKDTQDDLEHDYKEMGTYDNLDLTVYEDPSLQLWFDPEARATRSSTQSIWRQVNEHLDRYGGYFLLGDGSSIHYISDNVFIPLDRPFIGQRDCKGTPYYVRPE